MQAKLFLFWSYHEVSLTRRLKTEQEWAARIANSLTNSIIVHSVILVHYWHISNGNDVLKSSAAFYLPFSPPPNNKWDDLECVEGTGSGEREEGEQGRREGAGRAAISLCQL